MAGRNEVAKATIYLDGKQAESALAGLKRQAEEFRKALKQAQAAGDQVKMNKIQKELTSVESAQRSLRKETYDYQKVLKNLNGASLSELRTALRTIEVQMNKMSRTDPGYAKMREQARLLRGEINHVNASMREQDSRLGKLADGFNKYMGVIAAASAGFAAVSMVVGQQIKNYAAFDDKLADVMKTTGLTKDQVVSLNEELKKIDTRSSQEDLLDLARVAGKLGISAENDVLGFVRAADKINVALAEDLGGNTEEAINELGKLTDIFKLNETYGMEESLIKIGSAINSLGAAGTASELYLVEFSKRMAGIAPSAGITVEQVLGLAATLDELGQSSEISATAMTQTIGAMFRDIATYAGIAGISVQEFTKLLNTDANEALIKVLQGARGSGTGFSEMAKNLDQLGLDGARSTAVLSVLANNLDKLREKQSYANDEFSKGTSLQNEFSTKNTTIQAQLDKAKKAFSELGRELGEKLMPAYASIISKSKLLMVTLISIIEFVSKYGKQITVTAVSVAAYTAAVKIAANWTRIQSAYTVTASAVETAYATVKGVLTGKIKLATVAQRAWNLALKANPIGLIASLLAGAVTWLVSFEKKTGKVSTALHKAGDYVIDLANQFVELYNASLPVRVAVNYITASIKTGFTAAKVVVQSFWEELKLGGKLMKSILTFDLNGIKQAFSDYSNNMKSAVVESARDIADTWQTGFNNAMKGKMKPITRKADNSVMGPEEESNSEDILTPERTPLVLPDSNTESGTGGAGKGQKSANIEEEKKASIEHLSILQEELETKKDILLKLSDEDELYALKNTDLTRKIEENAQDRIRAWEDELQSRQEIGEAIFEISGEAIDVFTELAGKETAAGKALFLLNQARAVGEVVFNTGIANAKAVAASPLTFGQPWVGINTASAAVSIASIIAQSITKIKGNEYAEGGYTGSGDKYEPAGIVHRGEWVAPREMVHSNRFAPVISWLEINRRAGNFSRVNIPDASVSRQGYAEGGFVSRTSAGEATQQQSGITGEQAEALTAAIHKLTQWKPRVYTELIKKDLDTLESIERNSRL